MDAVGAREGTRVVVADDDVLLREGVASLLTGAGFTVVGQAGDSGELLALVRDTVIGDGADIGARCELLRGARVWPGIEIPDNGIRFSTDV